MEHLLSLAGIQLPDRALAQPSVLHKQFPRESHLAKPAAVRGLCPVSYTHLNGVREGTVAAAILVGFIARLMGRKLEILPRVLFGKTKAPQEDTAAPEQTVCVVIDRQYGSGGQMCIRDRIRAKRDGTHNMFEN